MTSPFFLDARFFYFYEYEFDDKIENFPGLQNL